MSLPPSSAFCQTIRSLRTERRSDGGAGLTRVSKVCSPEILDRKRAQPGKGRERSLRGPWKRWGIWPRLIFEEYTVGCRGGTSREERYFCAESTR